MFGINLDRFDSILPESLRYWRDKRITQRIFLKHYGRSFDWNNPKTFSEKLQVFKIAQLSEKYAPFVDKWEMRSYVKKILGEKYLVKTYGCFTSVEEIDISNLPHSFVMKPTHGSGWIILCKDKKIFNWSKEKEKLRAWLTMNYYYFLRERPYRLIKPRIIIEEYLQDNTQPLISYEIHCFKGKPIFINIVVDLLSKKYKQCMYDTKWNLLYLGYKKEEGEEFAFPRPKNLEQLLRVAAKLSSSFPYVRVDLYSIQNTIYFSELTFTGSSGFFRYLVGKWDILFGNYYHLETQIRQ